MNIWAVISIIVTITLTSATPLIFGALGATFSERSGVSNIGIEGMMIAGGYMAALGSYFTAPAITQMCLNMGMAQQAATSWGDNLAPLAGLVLAMISGALFALLLAFLSIQFRANQIVVGVAINILAASFTTFGLIAVWGVPGQTPPVASFTPILAKTDIPILNNLNLLDYLALILVPIVWFILYKTPAGLRIRAVGEHPRAADTLGVSVSKVRYWSVTMSGILSGIGGAALSIGIVSSFREGMVSGKGFIAIAAMIFGRWHPVGAALACLFFGLADGFRTIAPQLGINIPSEFLFIMPYLFTILAVSGVIGRATAPAADGVPYEKK